MEQARFDSLDHEHALENALIDKRDTQKRLVRVFSGFLKIFETRMALYVLHRDGPHLFGDQSGQAFLDGHPQRADTLRPQSERGGEYQVRAVRLKQVCGAHIGMKAPRDQRDHVHQCFRRLTSVLRKIADFLQS